MTDFFRVLKTLNYKLVPCSRLLQENYSSKMAVEDIKAFLILSFRVIQTFAPRCIYWLSIFLLPSNFLSKPTSSPESTGSRRVLKVNCSLPMEAFLKKVRLASVKKNCLSIDREGHYPTVRCCNENLISLKEDERKLLGNKRNYTLHDPLGLARLWSKTMSLNWGTT